MYDKSQVCRFNIDKQKKIIKFIRQPKLNNFNRYKMRINTSYGNISCENTKI